MLSGAFAGRELELNKALTTLGRPGVQVAAVTRRADGFYIVHVEAASPTTSRWSMAPPSARRRAGCRQRRHPARGREDGVLRGLETGSGTT